MGSRMAAHLVKAGHDVTVWNRTADATKPLIAAGATQAQTPREAAAGAAFVVAMVRADEASRMVLLDANNGALGGMAAGAVALESSTLTPGRVRELGHAVAERGVALLEAPVSGSRDQTDAGNCLACLVDGGCLRIAPAIFFRRYDSSSSGTTAIFDIGSVIRNNLFPPRTARHIGERPATGLALPENFRGALRSRPSSSPARLSGHSFTIT